MIPKPQANTLDELMLRFQAEMFTYRNVLNPTTEWSKLTAHQRSVVNTYRSEFEALISEARADEVTRACEKWEEQPSLPATYMIDRLAQLKEKKS